MAFDPNLPGGNPYANYVTDRQNTALYPTGQGYEGYQSGNAGQPSDRNNPYAGLSTPSSSPPPRNTPPVSHAPSGRQPTGGGGVDSGKMKNPKTGEAWGPGQGMLDRAAAGQAAQDRNEMFNYLLKAQSELNALLADRRGNEGLMYWGYP